jgi:hypothetical protein
MMKRSIALTVVIALMAVAVFGSQALAVPPQTLPTTQNILDLLLGMNQTVTDIQAEAADIEGKLDDPATGLAEIKAEVATIEQKVNEMDAELDDMVKMVSYSGVVAISPGNSTTPVEETYPEARHVVLTVSLFSLDGFAPPDSMFVFDHSVIGVGGGSPVLIAYTQGYWTVEFVTKEWSIEAGYSSSHTGDLYLDYKYTVTYPG